MACAISILAACITLKYLTCCRCFLRVSACSSVRGCAGVCVCMSVCMDAPSRQLTACASPGSRSNTEFDYQSCSKTSNATAIVATLVGLLVAVIFFFVWLVVQHQGATSYLAYHQQVRSSEDDKTCVGTRAQLRC